MRVRVFGWIRSFFLPDVFRELALAQRQYRAALREKEAAESALALHVKRLVELKERSDEEWGSAQAAIRKSNLALIKMQEALDAMEQKLKVSDDIVIPSLVAANETFRRTWDAQSARAAGKSLGIKVDDGD
jgi:hypothetical protein